MVTQGIGQLLDYYGRLIDPIDKRYYDSDGMQALLLRDQIEDRLAELDAQQRAELARLDRRLAEQWELVSEIAPPGSGVDRKRWWWFLHEGPQVREDAERAVNKVS